MGLSLMNQYQPAILGGIPPVETAKLGCFGHETRLRLTSGDAPCAQCPCALWMGGSTGEGGPGPTGACGRGSSAYGEVLKWRKMTFESIGWGAFSSFLGPQLIGVSLKV